MMEWEFYQMRNRLKAVQGGKDMGKKVISDSMMKDYCSVMHENEMSIGTIKKYYYYLNLFREYVNGRQVSKENVILWKEELKERFSPVTANSALAALNGFLRWAGWEDCTVRLIKVKQRVFCSRQRELSREEYKRLVNVARSEGNERLSLLLQTVCSTGIRISELNYITVNAVDKQIAEVDCKGKVRTVFLTDGLCRLLKAYARKMNIVSGMIFVTRNGRPLDRSNIWREMKRISHKAGVNPDKVFPHNLRHLFARVYYSQEKDLVRLADILGHSSVNTTRIYTMESGENHLRQLEKMDLLIDRYNRIPLLL
jgi:site-specific recombinase XerD